ncbi:hypothetical protein QQS21_003722 [Conoideocrella luteorostrata]|uniref:DUF4604 domain-containing protein n=1 Tax=Conoideocrella luteorostrata TaxID=1105319 RepID=A0AAJ0FVC3_9HYPO|nr:hypothetical protein QQS21_003722 [Conoideocrella luteorostrata]
MPEKITSKNLSYSSSLPPFLARLHAQAGGASGPDPLLAAQRRSVKKRSSSEEAEDAPLVVDEHGNNVNVQVEKDGTVKETESNGGEDDNVSSGSGGKTEKLETEGKSSIGARKRKTGKVIGGGAADSQDTDGADKKMSDQKEEAPAERKAKKKAKKIKLSFDEDEN